MLRALLVAIVLATASAGAACGGVSARGLVAAKGLEGAADELRLRLVRDPRDVSLWVALADVEEQRGRPGAALEALDRADRLGRPFRGGLEAWPRSRFAALYLARARLRAERDSPDAEADLARARSLGATIDPAIAHRAALAAIGADLRHSDPDRRARGQARLQRDHATLAAGLAIEAPPADVERTTAWLVSVGARRLAFETLDRIAERTVATAATTALPPWPAITIERWLTLRRWWSGTGDPIDRVTLDEAAARGASICAYASDAFPACSGANEAPSTIDTTSDTASDTAIDDALATSDWPAIAARIAHAAEEEQAALADVARAYERDPALADRRAEDVAARTVDAAESGPVLGRLFAALGDPARARVWWQRAYDASPEDGAIVMGLAIAMASAKDPPAGVQLAWRAAAASGDAAATFYRAARGFAAAGQTLDALGLARAAIEQSAPGDEDPGAGLAAALLRTLGREVDAAEVGAMAGPGEWDLGAARTRVEALAARGPAGVAGLVRLAGDDDPAAVPMAAAALRTIVRESAAPARASGLP